MRVGRAPLLARWCLPAVLFLIAACSRGNTPAPGSLPPPVPEVAPAGTRLAPTPAHAGPLDPAVTTDDLDALWARQLMVPVEGITRAVLKDNFTAGRGNSRLHAALDILAPKSTPVLAADDHVIGRLTEGPVGGIVIYASDLDARFVYYYAHLQRYRRGLSVGDRVAKGSVIGYVGTTGNAPPNTPHLHFQVMKRGRGRAWWDGPPINAFSFFALDGLRP